MSRNSRREIRLLISFVLRYHDLCFLISYLMTRKLTRRFFQLGVLLNLLKRMLDSLRPQIEAKLKQWSSCMPETGNMVPDEKLSEITMMISSKFRAYMQAVVDKLVENVSIFDKFETSLSSC